MSEITLFVGKGDSRPMTDLAKREEARGAIVAQNEIQVWQKFKSEFPTLSARVLAIGDSIRSKGCLIQLIANCLNAGINTTVDLERCFVDKHDSGGYGNVAKRKEELLKQLGDLANDTNLIITP